MLFFAVRNDSEPIRPFFNGGWISWSGVVRPDPVGLTPASSWAENKYLDYDEFRGNLPPGNIIITLEMYWKTFSVKI